MDNQKIILLTHEYPPKRGGAGTYCEELVYASQKIGIPIEAWVPDYATKPNDTHLYGLPIKGSQDWICNLERESFHSTRSFFHPAIHLNFYIAQICFNLLQIHSNNSSHNLLLCY